jgi:hypothetical protein
MERRYPAACQLLEAQVVELVEDGLDDRQRQGRAAAGEEVVDRVGVGEPERSGKVSGRDVEPVDERLERPAATLRRGFRRGMPAAAPGRAGRRECWSWNIHWDAPPPVSLAHGEAVAADGGTHAFGPAAGQTRHAAG